MIQKECTLRLIELFLNIILGGGRFHMLPQSYRISHGHCLNNPLQVLLIGNQRDQLTLFKGINQDDEVFCLLKA